MSGKKKILVISLLIFIIICTISIFVLYNKYFNHSIKAVVVAVAENYLKVMKLDGTNSNVYELIYSKDGNINFKEGQEILVYIDYDTIVDHSGGTIHRENIKKVEIIKEKSETEIPIEILRRTHLYMHSPDISIDEFTPNTLSFTIKDTNKYKYGYSNNFSLMKKINNSSQDVPKISNDYTELNSINIDNNTFKKTCDFKTVYGTLEPGEYTFQLISPPIWIIIYFTIDDNGNISYNEPIYWIW